MKGIYLILGSNLGSRFESIAKAIGLIRERIGSIEAASSIYKTEPWGYEHQPHYLNQVIRINTILTPKELLDEINKIEVECGRIRNGRWRERVLDIDILYYNNEVIKSDEIEIPHPQIQNRLFTLIPLCELVGEEVHPVSGKTQKQMLEACSDTLKVNKIQNE
jgi:2-amino-4-hydroxy-6-hydroxymethyldihydropteridine diphosphokinase